MDSKIVVAPSAISDNSRVPSQKSELQQNKVFNKSYIDFLHNYALPNDSIAVSNNKTFNHC